MPKYQTQSDLFTNYGSSIKEYHRKKLKALRAEFAERHEANERKRRAMDRDAKRLASDDWKAGVTPLNR